MNLNVLGNEITIHTASDDFALVEYVAAPGFPGPPPHVHPAFDEIFYVLDGEMRFTLGDSAVVAGPGDPVHARGDAPHTFANTSDRPARMLIVLRPGGFERFFAEAAELAAAGRLDEAARAELNARHGVSPVAG
jgi:quercetin dioxygenase-like cupin family protein